jgi:amino acid transporter
MSPLQLLLTVTALLTAAGGLFMLFRRARHDPSPRSAYIPLATTAVGLIIAYRSISEFASMDAEDLTIMFLFALGLLSFMGLQFFIADKHKPVSDVPDKNEADRNPPRNL